MTESTSTPEALEYRTEVKQLLDILAHSLYTDREIFLRELISNASDALNRLQYLMLTQPDVLDAGRELAIRVRGDETLHTLTIEDSGIGMTHDELVQNLGTIAHSGAAAFLQNADAGQMALEEIIGQFGVGFYSVFMVADEVTVVSRSYQTDEQAWQWRSTGDSTYTLEPAEKPERGTTITIKLKADAAEFAGKWRLEQIIRKHSDYVSYPIYVVDKEGAESIANRRSALWRQSPGSVKSEEYDDFYKQLTLDTENPLLHIHLVADAPVNLRAILYVPTQRERGSLHLRPEHGLRLYSRKILIQQHNQDLLPEYFRFVDGVVDSEDLPLNVSRETVQSSPVMRQMRRALAGRLQKELKTLADNEPERYQRFWAEFGPFVKQGVAIDPAGQDGLLELLRFQSSKSSASLISFHDYVARMQPEQKAIYYVLGEDLKSVARSPHLDYFRAHDLEVLYLVDPIDGFMTSMLHEVEGKPLQNVDDAGLELPADDKPAEAQPTPVEEGEFGALTARAAQVLGERVREVRESKQLVNSPCRLVTPEDSFDRDLQRLRRLTEEDYTTPAKILELNRRHPMIANLAHVVATTPDDPLIDAALVQLYDNALLLEGLHASPVEMVERIQILMEAALAAHAGARDVQPQRTRRAQKKGE